MKRRNILKGLLLTPLIPLVKAEDMPDFKRLLKECRTWKHVTDSNCIGNTITIEGLDEHGRHVTEVIKLEGTKSIESKHIYTTTSQIHN